VKSYPFRHPKAARRATAQRLDRNLDPVARLEGLAAPAVARQVGGTEAFERPAHRRAILLPDLQDDQGVRRNEPELADDAVQLDLFERIEHGGGVVRSCWAAG